MDPECKDNVGEEDNTDLQANIPKASYDWSGLIASVMCGSMVLLTIWGIGWSFHRHGPMHGAAAFFIPPYAWYRGVASIWDEPLWKDGWDVKTETIGTIVSLSTDSLTKVELIEYRDRVRKWISSLPKEEKERLRKRVVSFGKAVIQCGDNLSEDISSKSDLRPMTHSSVQSFVNNFSDDKGLLRAWDQLGVAHKIMMVNVQKQIDEMLTEEFHEAIRKNKYNIELENNIRIKMTQAAIEDLFDEDCR